MVASRPIFPANAHLVSPDKLVSMTTEVGDTRQVGLRGELVCCHWWEVRDWAPDYCITEKRLMHQMDTF